MSDAYNATMSLRRPRLLIQAARVGLREYRRDKYLLRLLKISSAPYPEGAVKTLLPLEEALEDARRSGDASYSPARHVEIFTALLSEARQLARSRLLT